MYEARDGDIFSAKSLKTLLLIHEELLADQLEQGENPVHLNHIVEIKYLINASFQDVDGDNLQSRQFIGNRLPKLIKHEIDYANKPWQIRIIWEPIFQRI